MDSPAQFPFIDVPLLKGVNERLTVHNPDVGEFMHLRGCAPLDIGSQVKLPGCKLYDYFGEEILSICQTGDSRGNIIIQTRSSVQIITEEQLFSVPYIPSLTIQTQSEEEDMAYAVLVHSVPAGTVNATTGILTWSRRPLTHIASQINPDGSAASFVSLASNQFTLAPGVYRLRGNFVLASSAVASGQRVGKVRLYNATAGTAAWAGLPNEESVAVVANEVRSNFSLQIMGHLNLAAPTLLEIQDQVSHTGILRGIPSSMGNVEIYGMLEILKSA